MKTWKIPVFWKIAQVAEIRADTLEEAIYLAKLHSHPEVTTPNCTILNNPRVVEDEEYVRWIYNNEQEDEKELQK